MIFHRRLQIVAALTSGAVLLVGAKLPAQRPDPLAALQTRAERTRYQETSRYDDVVRFLDEVAAASELVHVATFGYSFEGRPLPLAVIGRVADARPETVRASGKLRVYIQANVHAGEVEGKEAMLALARDIARGGHRDWLDSLVLLVAPIYNADGNDRVSLTNRGPQHGPIGGMGTRANAQNLNINRDYIKLETPEARSMVKLLNDYDPQVMLDLHTTDGSRHAYYLTYETPNNPAVDRSIADLSRGWMTAITKTVSTKYDWDFHAYGNVSGQAPERTWSTVEDLPRYSHNYWGIRNRIGILSETYSYLTFQDRITACTRFVEEVLNMARTGSQAVQQTVEAADRIALAGTRLSLRSAPARSNEMITILMGETVDEINPFSGRVMYRRVDVRKPERMWEFATFAPTETERVPSAYFVPASLDGAVNLLRAHGIRLEPLTSSLSLPIEEFRIESSQATAQAFENHRERTITGKYQPDNRIIPAGTWRVATNQPLGRLVFYLLEPRSNDGVLTWNVLDQPMGSSTVYPIVRSQDGR